ncbi:hypothetical protein [Streptomyces sp. NBC_01538]|uniref:hypothetical protein n=1 Tax=Streptomyces sp. NBC_01538 TaxID=2903897 RepID=UPI003869FF53
MTHHYKRPEKYYVTPGETVVVKCGASECMMSMGLTNKFMPVTILDNGYGQMRDLQVGHDYSMPTPLSWISCFYEDTDGRYGTEVYEIGVGHTVTHTSGRFYVYVDGKKLYGVQSPRFEEMREAAREMHGRDIPSAEVRFVENSRHLPTWWSRSVVVPLDAEVRGHVTRTYRDTWVDLPTHFNLFAGRHHLQEGLRVTQDSNEPQVWTFYSTGEAYGAVQCREEIHDGDVLVIEREKVVGIAETWPFALTEAFGELHMLKPDFRTYKDGAYAASIPVAEREAARIGVPLTRLDAVATERFAPDFDLRGSRYTVESMERLLPELPAVNLTAEYVTRVVESALLHIPLPPVIVSVGTDRHTYVVRSGGAYLSALREFCREGSEYRLTGGEFELPDGFPDATFAELPGWGRTRIREANVRWFQVRPVPDALVESLARRMCGWPGEVA